MRCESFPTPPPPVHSKGKDGSPFWAQVSRVELSRLGPPGVPLYQCVVEPMPPGLANKSISVQVSPTGLGGSLGI